MAAASVPARQLQVKRRRAERRRDREHVVELGVRRLHVLLHTVRLVRVNRDAGVVVHLPDLLDLVQRHRRAPLPQLIGRPLLFGDLLRRGFPTATAPATATARPSLTGRACRHSASHQLLVRRRSGRRVRAAASATRTTGAPGPGRGSRTAEEVLDRPVHQLNRADAGIDHVLQGRLSALVGHRAVAIGDDSELNAAKLRVWLPLREHRGEEWIVEERRRRKAGQCHFPEITSCERHMPSQAAAELGTLS